MSRSYWETHTPDATYHSRSLSNVSERYPTKHEVLTDSLLNPLPLKVQFPKKTNIKKKNLPSDKFCNFQFRKMIGALTATLLSSNSTIALPFLEDDTTRATTSPYCTKKSLLKIKTRIFYILSGFPNNKN